MPVYSHNRSKSQPVSERICIHDSGKIFIVICVMDISYRSTKSLVWTKNFNVQHMKNAFNKKVRSFYSTTMKWSTTQVFIYTEITAMKYVMLYIIGFYFFLPQRILQLKFQFSSVQKKILLPLYLNFLNWKIYLKMACCQRLISCFSVQARIYFNDILNSFIFNLS